MLSKRKLEEKHERILRRLLKQGGNKRCVNCESIGPQYALPNFNVFVCMICSGIHRQFGHRVKGVSMSTFAPEEIDALEKGGNEMFMETYCAKWKAEALPKPLDRSAQHVSSWINAVYVEKRFYDEKVTKKIPSPETSGSGQPNRIDSTAQSVDDGEEDVDKKLPIAQQTSISTTSARSLSNNNDVAVVSMAEIFGGDVPRLEISPQRNTSGGGLEPSSSAHDAKTSADEESGNQIESESVKNVESMSKKPTSLLDLGDSWDPFGALTQEQSPDAYPAAEASSNVFQDNGHTEDHGASVVVPDRQDIRDAVQGHHTGESKSWEAFKEDLPVETSASTLFPGFESLTPPEFPGFDSTKEPPTAIWKGTPSTALSDNVGQADVSISEKESAVGNWASFGAVADDTKHRQAHDQTMPSKPDTTSPKIASSSTSQDQASNVGSGHNAEQNMAPPISKANAGSSSSLSSSATTGGQSSRPEVPLDVFFPEFQAIRATGVLPTGEPLPPQLRGSGVDHVRTSPQVTMPMWQDQSKSAGVSFNQFNASPQATSLVAVETRTGVRTTMPNSYMSSDTSISHSSQYRDALPTGSPDWIGSEGSRGIPFTTTNNSSANLSAPISSTGISPGAGYGAATGPVDVFDGFGTSLHGALPNPSMTPATSGHMMGEGHNVSPSMQNNMMVHTHGSVGNISQHNSPSSHQAVAASATLFGMNEVVGAYNLNAPKAAKANMTGNPFA